MTVDPALQGYDKILGPEWVKILSTTSSTRCIISRSLFVPEIRWDLYRQYFVIMVLRTKTLLIRRTLFNGQAHVSSNCYTVNTKVPKRAFAGNKSSAGSLQPQSNGCGSNVCLVLATRSSAQHNAMHWCGHWEVRSSACHCKRKNTNRVLRLHIWNDGWRPTSSVIPRAKINYVDFDFCADTAAINYIVSTASVTCLA